MDTLIPFAASIAIKAAILFGAAALAIPLLRRRSAALRHLVWSLAIGGSVLLPVVAALTPVTIPVLPARAPSAVVAVDEQADADPHPVAEASRGAAAPVEPASESSAPPMSRGVLLLVLWLAGAGLFIARFAIGMVRLRRMVKRAVPVEDPSWVAVANRTRAEVSRTPLEIRVSDEVDMPFATGLVTPAIVLPAAAAEWSAERREAVLLHELAHLSRGDLLMNAFSHVARALYWFNPLAWYAAHRLRVEGECAADDAVLRRGARASDYADHLLSIATNGHTVLPTAALALARRSAFEGRLLAILSADADRVAPSRLRVAATTLAFALIILPLAAASPTARAAALPPLQDPSEQQAEPRVQQASSAVPALIEALADANASVRLAAVQSLGSLEDPRAIAALAKALKEDSDPRVREAAASALADIDDARAVPHLVEALRTEKVAAVRERVIHALGEIGDESAIEAVASASKDPNVGVRRAVAHALDELDGRQGLPALIAMARDTDIEVRRNVASALSDLQSDDAYETLVMMARDADAEVRASAIDGIGELEDARSLNILVAALRDPAAEVRSQAADAIQNIDDIRTAPPALIAALTDPSHDVRHNVAHALGNIGDDAAVPALKRQLADTNAEVRRAVVEALADIGGPEAITALMGLLKDQDPEVRRTAAEALGKRR